MDWVSVARMESNQVVPLPEGEIHLWLTLYSEINDEFRLSMYRELLNDAEGEQETRFYFVRDQRRYLITRALVRTVLSRYAEVPPREWVFSAGAYGKPCILNPEAKEAGLSFNISHTHSMVVLAIAKFRDIGVDVENFRTRTAPIDGANHYFAPQEVAALRALPSKEQQYGFFEYWTFKESYIKARGLGMSLPLDKFSFCYPDDQTVEIKIEPVLGDEPARWEFWQLRPRQEYLLALCAERVHSQPSRVIVREVIPMLSEKEVPIEFRRVSTL